jgi:glutaredoxin
MLKDYLTQNKITFTEKLVDTDEAAKEEMVSLSGGFLGVPYTAITLDNGTRENVLGFDKGKLNSLLNLQG